MNRFRPKLSLEVLEVRDVPASFGSPWPDAQHLTVSFVPDGTMTQNGPSRLFQTMNSVAPTAVWQKEILRAIQTWADSANINIGVVADAGQPLGINGAVQGDSRFGDLRISATNTRGQFEASASPFHWTGTTLGGDIMFNSAQRFSVSGSSPGLDLYSVALHEAGHALGLGHNDVAGTVMAEDYHAYSGLGTSDIVDVQTLYGSRVVDANNTSSTATPLAGNLLENEINTVAELAGAADVDYYRFNVPALSILTPVSIRLKTAGMSLLASKITVTNSLGQTVGSTLSTDPLNGDLAVQFNPPLLGGQYTIKVEKAGSNFTTGTYKLAVNLGPLGGLSPLLNLPIVLLDGNSDDPPLTGQLLTSLNPQGDDHRFDYYKTAAIEGSNDTDSFAIVAPSKAGQSLNVLAWSFGSSVLNPRVRVFNSTGTELPAAVLSNQGGLTSVRIANAAAGATYYVQVSARTPGSTGQYALAADFNKDAAPAYTPLAERNVGSVTQTFTTSISAAGLFQFSLATGSAAGVTGTVKLTVKNALGQVIFTLEAASGQTMTTSQLLTAGQYTVELSRAGTGLLPVTLRTLKLSDQVGTYKTKTATSAVESVDPPVQDTTATPRFVSDIYIF